MRNIQQRMSLHLTRTTYKHNLKMIWCVCVCVCEGDIESHIDLDNKLSTTDCGEEVLRQDDGQDSQLLCCAFLPTE